MQDTNKKSTGAEPTPKKKQRFKILRYLFGNRNELDILQEERVQSPWRTVMRTFARNKLSMAALIIFLIIVVVMVVGPIILPVDLGYHESLQQNLPPGRNLIDFPAAMRENPRDIEVGRAFSIGVDQHGKVHVWGHTNLFSMPDLSNIPEAVQQANIVKVAAGFDHVLALDDQGKVYAWGSNRLRQTRIPREIDRLRGITEIFAGYQFSIVLTEDGKSAAFGNLMNLDYDNFHPYQGQLAKVASATDVVCGLTKSGEIVYLGLFDNAYSRVPADDRTYVDIAGGARSFMALADDGSLHPWGNLSFRGEGRPPAQFAAKPVALVGGQYHYTVLLENGQLASWGDNANSQTTIPAAIQNGTYDKIFAGYYQNYAVSTSGQTAAFGLKGYLLGTDEFGRDVFVRILNGGRLTLTIGSVAVIIATLIGMIMGGISGYFGGNLDLFLQRFGEIVNALPFLPTVIILNSVIGNRLTPIQRVYFIMVLLGLLSWVNLMRLIRAQVLSIREQEFVVAARSIGIKEMGIVFRHIIPNVISIIIVSATLSFASSLLTEAVLSFIGFGVQQPRPTWGNMLFGANNSTIVQQYWWRWVFPAAILSVCVICINLVGTGLDDAIDPKSQER